MSALDTYEIQQGVHICRRCFRMKVERPTAGACNCPRLSSREMATAILTKILEDGALMDGEVHVTNACSEELEAVITKALDEWLIGVNPSATLAPTDALEYHKRFWKITPEALDEQMGVKGFTFTSQLDKVWDSRFDRTYTRGTDVVRLRGYYDAPGEIKALASYGLSDDFTFVTQT